MIARGAGHAVKRVTREGAHRAAEWISSPSGQRVISSVTSNEMIKMGISVAIKSAIFHVANVMDPHVDAQVEAAVERFSSDAHVSRAKGRQMMASAVRKLRSARSAEK